MADPGVADPTDPRDRFRRLFDAVAERYDDVGVDFFGPIAAGLVRALAPAPGDWVADLGCGKGAFLLPAAQAVGPQGRVVGVDISSEMVAAATRASAGVRNVEVRLGDAQAPDLPAGGFDVLGSSLVLFFLPDPGAALAAWASCLRPGGRLGVSTFGDRDAVWKSLGEVFWPYLPPPMRVRPGSSSAADDPFATDAGVANLMAGAGLCEVRTEVLDLVVRFADVAQWEDFSRSTGELLLWQLVPESELPAVRAQARRLLSPAADPRGGYVLHWDIRYTLGVAPSS